MINRLPAFESFASSGKSADMKNRIIRMDSIKTIGTMLVCSAERGGLLTCTEAWVRWNKELVALVGILFGGRRSVA